MGALELDWLLLIPLLVLGERARRSRCAESESTGPGIRHPDGNPGLDSCMLRKPGCMLTLLNLSFPFKGGKW